MERNNQFICCHAIWRDQSFSTAFSGPVAIVGTEVQNGELLFMEGTGSEELQNSGSKKGHKGNYRSGKEMK